MLALVMVSLFSPRSLLLDEPSLGLAPTLVPKALQQIEVTSRSGNVAVMIVEQTVREALKIADSVCVLRNGCVSFSGPADELRDDRKLRHAYL